MYYYASRLNDGTVIATFPVRKPTPHVMKRDHLRIEEDGICEGGLRSGAELRDCNDDRRFRFQDIIANSLNARRAVRDIALPILKELREEVAAVRSQLDRIEKLFGDHVAGSS
jgi:hypothetical protein